MKPIRTSLIIGDKRIANTRENLEKGQPAALDGLEINYGRNTSIDDVKPGSLSGQILIPDDTQAQAFINQTLKPGASVDVQAEYDIDTTGNTPIQSLNVLPMGLATKRVGPSVEVTAAARPATIWIAPAPFEEPGQNSGSWNAINPPLYFGTPMSIGLQMTVKEFLPKSVRAWLVALPNPSIDANAPVTPLYMKVKGDLMHVDNSEKYYMPAAGYPAIKLEIPAGSFDKATSALISSSSLTLNSLSTVAIYEQILITPERAALSDRPVFSGYLTGWTARKTAQGTLIDIEATDILGRLDTLMLGAPPRPRETVHDRIKWALNAADRRIALVSNATRNPLVEVLDVDNRSALDIIQEAARAASLTVWASARPDGADTILIDDADTHEHQATLSMNGPYPVITTNAKTNIGAHIIPQNGVTISGTSDETITKAVVTWVRRTLDEDGEAHEETQTSTAGTSTGATIKIDTRLTRHEDAVETANAYLRRIPMAGWKTSGITIDTRRVDSLDQVTRLIDIRERPALPVLISDLPGWTPGEDAERFTLQGARITTQNNAYMIDMTLTRPANIGKSMQIDQVPAALLIQNTGTLVINQFAGLMPANQQ